jgi:RNA polymerase sigma-70 factor, ECF subfamily
MDQSATPVTWARARDASIEEVRGRAVPERGVPSDTAGGVPDVVGVTGAATGDAGYDALFRAHYGPLVRSLTLAAGDRELAADCVADAFERCYVRWRRIQRYDDPAGWVRRVAINRLRDHARRRGRGERAVERLSAGRERTAAPDELVELAELLAGLPTQQRIAVALRYVGGLAVAEVADAMGISEGAVKYHLHAGRERLRPLLGEAP